MIADSPKAVIGGHPLLLQRCIFHADDTIRALTRECVAASKYSKCNSQTPILRQL